MSIGEFAQLTGLGVKALRHYDERGVLQPADVDPVSRYRRYGVEQVGPALRLRALRRAGLPLTDAPVVMAGGDAASSAIERFRERLALERAEQDDALEALARHLAEEAGGQRWEVVQRDAPAQHWVGALLPVTDDEASGESDDGATERADGVFAAVWQGLQRAGHRPTGAPWSAFRVDPGSEDSLQLLCCWPVDGPVPAGWHLPGVDVVVGCTPAGPRLVSRWSHDDDPVLETDQLHPAVLALLVEAGRRGADVRLQDLRQVVLMAPDGTSAGTEVTVPLVG
ncbi:MerR family transcriptional regulator [Aquipuribacter sp. MA13-6]|uniref:MerR family transcriptional regulator n=1 Tax=unclassified Aquipuribacter TaxID=2635084 RepID=UPI003EEFCE00